MAYSLEDISELPGGPFIPSKYSPEADGVGDIS
jgi:hypothetical protein